MVVVGGARSRGQAVCGRRGGEGGGASSHKKVFFVFDPTGALILRVKV